MKKLLVYPFSVDSSPLARYREMLTDYDEIVPVAENNDILEGKDTSCFDGGKNTEVLMGGSFEREITHCDTVLFTGEPTNKDTALALFKVAKANEKDIIVCGSFNKHLTNEQQSYRILSGETLTNSSHKDHLEDIPVPVILVMGQGQQCQKFNIQLGLRKKLLESGYKVSQVGTKEYCPLFGFHNLPLLPECSLPNRILRYNKFFLNLVEKEDPDVLVVGIPGGIMPINEKNTELFGETAISISKSLNPDITIASLYNFPEMEEGLFDEIENYSNYALNAVVDYFHISNTKLFFKPESDDLGYITIKGIKTLNKLNDINKDIFNIFIEESADSTFSDIISSLQENIEVL